MIFQIYVKAKIKHIPFSLQLLINCKKSKKIQNISLNDTDLPNKFYPFSNYHHIYYREYTIHSDIRPKKIQNFL